MSSANDSTGLIGIIEAGSGYDPEKPLDPTLLRYRTSIFPAEVGVELLVRDLEQFRALAKSAEPRLRPFLLEIAYSFDCALGAKSSENGKMLDMITISKSSQTMMHMMGGGKKKGDHLDKLNDMFGDMTNPHNNTDFGNKNY